MSSEIIPILVPDAPVHEIHMWTGFDESADWQLNQTMQHIGSHHKQIGSLIYMCAIYSYNIRRFVCLLLLFFCGFFRCVGFYCVCVSVCCFCLLLLLETPSYFVFHLGVSDHQRLWLDLVHLKKDFTDASVYKQCVMEIRDRYRDYIPFTTDGSRDGNSVACATAFPSDTVISMILPDSVSIFSAEKCAIIKSLKQIKVSVATKYIIFSDTLSCLQALHYMSWNISWLGCWYESISF